MLNEYTRRYRFKKGSMDYKKLFAGIKRNWSNTLLVAILLVLLFSVNAKSWLLRQIISTGVINTEIKKSETKALPQHTNFFYTDAIGKSNSTESLKGKVIFINFWASWCPPCRAEMPSLEELYLKLKDDPNIIFIFINEDDDKQKGIDYFEKNQFTLPFYTQPGIIPPEIFNGTLPTTVVINKEGQIVLKHEGIAGYNTETFIKQLREME